MRKTLASILVLAVMSTSACNASYVKQGEVGLLISNMSGKIDKVLEPGYRMSVPIGQHIVEFPVIKQQYVMVAGHEGQRSGDDAVKVNSLEGQVFSVDASVDYQIQDKTQVPGLYQKYAMEFDNIVEKYYRSKFRTAISNAFAGLPMAEAMTRDGKLKVEAQALKDLQASLASDGIEVHEVMVRAIHAPEAITKSIEVKTQAENDLVTSRTIAQKSVVEAEAAAKAQLIRAGAEAESNRLVAASLNNNLIRMEYVKRLSDKVNIVLPEKSFFNFGGLVPQNEAK